MKFSDVLSVRMLHFSKDQYQYQYNPPILYYGFNIFMIMQNTPIIQKFNLFREIVKTLNSICLYLYHFYWIKHSMTNLQVLQISMKFLLQIINEYSECFRTQCLPPSSKEIKNINNLNYISFCLPNVLSLFLFKTPNHDLQMCNTTFK